MSAHMMAGRPTSLRGDVSIGKTAGEEPGNVADCAFDRVNGADIVDEQLLVGRD